MKRDFDRIAKQLSELERLYAASPDDSDRSPGEDGRLRPGEARLFMVGALSAASSIRREELDADRPFGYKTEALHGMHSQVLGQHICALVWLHHPDQDEALALLQERGEDELIGRALAVAHWFSGQGRGDAA